MNNILSTIIFTLNSSPFAAFFVFLFFSLCIGSFLNATIFRLGKINKKNALMKTLYINENLSIPSHDTIKHEIKKITPHASISLSDTSLCDHCQAPIKFYYNIPIMSYLFLKGKTACCQKSIPINTLLIEVSFPVVMAVLYLTTSFTTALVSLPVIGALFAGLFYKDDLNLFPLSVGAFLLLCVGIFFSLVVKHDVLIFYFSIMFFTPYLIVKLALLGNKLSFSLFGGFYTFIMACFMLNLCLILQTLIQNAEIAGQDIAYLDNVIINISLFASPFLIVSAFCCQNSDLTNRLRSIITRVIAAITLIIYFVCFCCYSL